MDFPGFDSFEPTSPLMHAIFLLRDAIPANCGSIRVELDERGAALVTAIRPDGNSSNVNVALTEDAMAAAGLLLNYASYQVITLTCMYEKQGHAAVESAQGRLRESLASFGLAFGLLDETLADTVTVSRR